MQNSFEVIKMAPENTNSILVVSGSDCVIFDAWGHADSWERLLQDRHLNLRAIYSTHGHGDHISASPYLAERFGIDWYLNHKDLPLILWSNFLLNSFGLPGFSENILSPKDLQSGEVNILPGIDMKVYEAPGHSKGGLVFYLASLNLLITGDTIFHNGFGRTDLPGGSTTELKQLISKIKALNLPENTYVVHGHDKDSTIGWLNKYNEYFA